MQLDVNNNSKMLAPASVSKHNVYQGRYASNLPLDACYASSPSLNRSNQNSKSQEEEYNQNGGIHNSGIHNEGVRNDGRQNGGIPEIQVNNLHVPACAAFSDSCPSPRLRNARNRLTSLLNIKRLPSDSSNENSMRPPKSPLSPRVSTPSLFRKMGIFSENNAEQNSKSNLRNESNGLSKSQLKKSVSFPSQSLQDISTCGRYSPHSPKHLQTVRLPFSGAVFMNKILNEDEQKEIFKEMIHCVQTNDCKALRSLVKRKLIDINTIIDQSSSLLHEAAYKGCLKCIKTILKNGCSVDICDDSGWTPLHASIFARQFEAVKCLIDSNASVNELSLKGWSPLHLAVFVGDLYIVHELVKSGGDPLRCNERDVSPFQLAINLNKTLILDYFLQLACFLVDT